MKVRLALAPDKTKPRFQTGKKIAGGTVFFLRRVRRIDWLEFAVICVGFTVDCSDLSCFVMAAGSIELRVFVKVWLVLAPDKINAYFHQKRKEGLPGSCFCSPVWFCGLVGKN